MCGGAPVVEEGDRGGKQGVRLQKPLEVVRLSRHCPPSARLFFDWLDPAREGAEDTVQT
jgi:hypothetical protein